MNGKDEWTADDEILALWLYDCFCRPRNIYEVKKYKYIAAAAEICGLKPGSFRMKLQNIAFLERKNCGKMSGGFTPLQGISDQNEAVFKALFHNKKALRGKAEAILAVSPGKFFLQKNILKALFM